MSCKEPEDKKLTENGTHQAVHQHPGSGLSRRNLLVGTAGVTVGTVIGTSAAIAQALPHMVALLPVWETASIVRTRITLVWPT